MKEREMTVTSFEKGLTAFDASSFSEAFQILIPLAKTGNEEAQRIVAGMFLQGQGVERNFTEAIKWYRLAAEQGDAIAQFNLASLLIHENVEQALQWLVAAAKQDFLFAQVNLGNLYSGYLSSGSYLITSFRNDSEAILWYQKAARKDVPLACHRLGDLYANGQGTEKNEKQAVEWYQKAAEMGYEPSQNILGEAYQNGLLGLPCDPQQAQYWFDKTKGISTTVPNATPRAQPTLPTVPAITDPAQVATLNQKLSEQVKTAWKPTTGLDQSLSYRVSVNADGQIVGYQGLDANSVSSGTKTPLVNLVQLPKTGGTMNSSAIAQFKVVFNTDKTLEVSPW
jgi:hypothetical protein